MKYASTAAQMRALDERVIAGLGLPGIALMELAARGAADCIRTHHDAQACSGVLVVCGPGNNGGDGWAIARWLSLWGYPVSVCSIVEPKSGTDAAIMRQVASRQGIRETSLEEVDDVGLIVDAIFGTGITREVGEPFASAIRAMVCSGRPIVAIDVPSGLQTDTGVVMGRAVRAERTVTFGRTKLGFYLDAGPEHTGPVEVIDIGLSAATAADALCAAEIPQREDLMPLWPIRRPLDHKGDLGHLLVIAGSAAMTGAAILACRGALAAGIGRITLLATSAMRARLSALPPEVMLLDGGEGDRIESLPDETRLAPFDAVAVGPGLGGGRPLPDELSASLSRAWRGDRRPWVADADALICTSPSTAARVLAPHPGEAARMLGLSPSQIAGDRMAAAVRLSERGVTLLKGRYTLVCAADALPSVNVAGAPTLATGGSGDVLTGVIGALLARGISPRDAARLGAWVHGCAGEMLAARRIEGWTASDVADAIAEALP